MASRTKKVVLFIVDGSTDENALSPVLKRIFLSQEVRFHVVHGDITSDRMSGSANVIKSVNEHIRFEMERYGFRRGDILKVIHLIDTDGAFIPDSSVKAGEGSELRYEEDQIITGNPEGIRERNAKKALILRRLYPAGTIGSIPYSVYYFSRNLEHVLHGMSNNLTRDEKIEFADRFSDQYDHKPAEFISFLSNSDFTVPGNYKESWEFILEGTNSLHRHCNLHLLFADAEA